MAYKLRISIQAQKDVLNAIDYYDQINPFLGSRFLSELFDIYQKITHNPEQYSYISSDKRYQFRDVKLRSFPYVVIYEVIDHNIYITAVLNTYKKPFIT